MTDTRAPRTDDAEPLRPSAPRLEIDVAPAGTRTRVAVRGELDIATAPQLAQSLAASPADRRRAVVLDVAGVTFCDASGLEVMLTAHRAHQAEGGSLVISGCSSRLLRLLRITGLDRVLAIEHPGHVGA